ncbi:hypothetical protein PIB30_071964, partial [Stylosanthes scabra]|nr:hypothetical protein [Stylosanthes scabra]
MARPPLLVAQPHELRLPKITITEASAWPHHLNGAPACLARLMGSDIGKCTESF